MPHYTQCLSSGEGRNYISGAKILLLSELIKEKLNKKQNDDDLINRFRLRFRFWAMPRKNIRVDPWSILLNTDETLIQHTVKE